MKRPLDHFVFFRLGSRRLLSAQAAPAADKLQRIVDDISQLTLLEVAALNQLLKKTLNIPDAPVVSYGAAPAAAPKEVSAQDYFVKPCRFFDLT